MILNCALYQQGSRIKNVSLVDVDVTALPENAFYWVALVDPSAEEMQQVSQLFNLHELAVEDSLKGSQRPKLDEYDQHLFMSIPLFELKQTISDDEETHQHISEGDFFIFAAPKYLVSVRRRSQLQFGHVRMRCEKEPELMQLGTGYVFYALLDAVVDHYIPLMTELEAQVIQIDQVIFKSGAARENLMRLYQLKQKVTQMKRSTLPLLEAVEKLYGGRVPALCRNLSEYFRDVGDHIQRFDSSIDFIRETVNTAIQVTLSMSAIEDAEITKKLASWGGILAVPTAMAGIWGMNFEHMPELSWTFGYPMVLALMLGMCISLYMHFKRLNWI